eukprot:jgi/Mesvir1/19856/Mv13146-RA.1
MKDHVQETILLTLRTADRARGDLAAPTWDIPMGLLDDFHDVGLELLSVPYEQAHITSRNNKFLFTTQVTSDTHEIFLPHGSYTCLENRANIENALRVHDPGMTVTYDRAKSKYTFSSPNAFSIQVSEYAGRVLGLLPLAYQSTTSLTSNRPATNGRLSSVFVYTDLVRGNVVSSPQGAQYGGLLAVLPVMSQYLEPIVWMSYQPLWQHLRESPTSISLRLLDEDDQPIDVYTDWVAQLAFRISPQKVIGSEARKISRVLKYVALKDPDDKFSQPIPYQS